MAETDFNIFGAAEGDVARGVTAAFTPPNGGGSFVFGWNSRSTGAQAVGMHPTGDPDFAPLRDAGTNATGGSIRGAIKRVVSVTPTGFSVGLFINLVGATENDYAYFLGLSDNDPHEIVLAKATGIAGLDPTASTILATSSATYLPDTWHHLRLDSIVNPNGDTVLRAFRNDLDTNPVTAPVWAAITGIDDFIDDALGINTEDTGLSTPLAGGFGGVMFQSEIVGARAFTDQLELLRQV
jgi:hypothetical protein